MSGERSTDEAVLVQVMNDRLTPWGVVAGDYLTFEPEDDLQPGSIHLAVSEGDPQSPCVGVLTWSAREEWVLIDASGPLLTVPVHHATPWKLVAPLRQLIHSAVPLNALTGRPTDEPEPRAEGVDDFPRL